MCMQSLVHLHMQHQCQQQPAPSATVIISKHLVSRCDLQTYILITWKSNIPMHSVHHQNHVICFFSPRYLSTINSDCISNKSLCHIQICVIKYHIQILCHQMSHSNLCHQMPHTHLCHQMSKRLHSKVALVLELADVPFDANISMVWYYLQTLTSAHTHKFT